MDEKSHKVDWLTLALDVVYLRRCAMVRYTTMLSEVRPDV